MRSDFCTVLIVSITATLSAADGPKPEWRHSVGLLQSAAEVRMKNQPIARTHRGAIAHIFAHDGERRLVCVDRIDCSQARKSDDDLIFGWIEQQHLLDVDEGRKLFDQELEPFDTRKDAAFGRGNVAYLDGKFEEALEYYAQAGDTAGTKYRICLHRAECFRRMQKYEAALKECSAANELSSSASAPFLAQARILGESIGSLSIAIDVVDLALSLNPDSSAARSCRAYLLLLKGDRTLAFEEAQKWEEMTQKQLFWSNELDLTSEVVANASSIFDVCNICDVRSDKKTPATCHANLHPAFHEQLIVGAAYREQSGDSKSAMLLISESLSEYHLQRRAQAVRFYCLGRTQVWNGNFAGAKRAFTSAAEDLSAFTNSIDLPVSMDTIAADVRSCAAGILYTQGRHSEALEELDQLVNNGAATATTYMVLASSQLALKDYEKAEDAFGILAARKEWGISPVVAGFTGRSHCRKSLGNMEGALDDLTAAVTLQPRKLELRHFRAKHCAEMARFEAAIADCDVILELSLTDADKVRGCVLRGQLFARTGKMDRALEDFDMTVKLSPDNPQYLNLRAHAYSELKQVSAAINDLKEVLRLDDRNLTALQGLAWIGGTSDDDCGIDAKSAIEYATKACELSRWKSSECVVALATALAQNGQFKEATARVEQARAMHPESEHWRDVCKKMLEQFAMEKPYRPETKVTEN